MLSLAPWASIFVFRVAPYARGCKSKKGLSPSQLSPNDSVLLILTAVKRERVDVREANKCLRSKAALTQVFRVGTSGESE